MKKVILIVVVGLILILIFNNAYAQEKITLSTYYPAPYGEYRKLAIGSSAGGYTAPTSADIDLVVEGNVGIGTTSPNVPLTIIEDSTTKIYQMRIDNADSTAVLYLGVVGSSAPSVSIRNHAIITNAGGSDLIFSTGNQEVMRLQDGGNVGIGTTSPTEKLEVDGAIKVGNTTGTNAGTIRWTGTAFEGYNGTSWVPLGGGTFVSSWAAISSGGNVTFANPLGTDQVIVTVQFKPTLGAAIRGQHTSDYAGWGYGVGIYEISASQIKVCGGSADMRVLKSDGMSELFSSGYVRVLLQAIN